MPNPNTILLTVVAVTWIITLAALYTHEVTRHDGDQERKRRYFFVSFVARYDGGQQHLVCAFTSARCRYFVINQFRQECLRSNPLCSDITVIYYREITKQEYDDNNRTHHN